MWANVLRYVESLMQPALDEVKRNLYRSSTPARYPAIHSRSVRAKLQSLPEPDDAR